MKKTTALALALLCACTMMAQRPRLVVTIVVDQMRWDYLYKYSEGRDNGFARLMSHGRCFDDVHVNYVPTVTACGHSSIYTGSVPALTGIAGNNFYVEGKKTYCTDDSTEQTVGSKSDAGRMSPRNLRVTTIGDELKLFTHGKSLVYGVSLKDRGAILPAGHTADAAYWFDKDNGVFISSSYYMQRLPLWMDSFNKANRQTEDVRYKPEGNRLVADMAMALLDNEPLGKDSITDMLAISFSSTDFIGHRYSPLSPETDEAYQELGKDLGRLFRTLDEKVGRDAYIVMFTADHGAPYNYRQMNGLGIDAGQWDEDSVRRATGAKDVIENRVYLARGQKTEEVAGKLRGDSQVAYAFAYDDLHRQTMPARLKSMVANGYCPDRSGDIVTILKPGHYASEYDTFDRGIEHGSPYSYDTHVPLIFMGCGISAGHSAERAVISDIAPTLCHLLGIPYPSGCIGHPVM